MQKLSSKLFKKFEDTQLSNPQMNNLLGGLNEKKTTYGGGAGYDMTTHGQSDATDSNPARDKP